jgi:7tm Chemosensory receptor
MMLATLITIFFTFTPFLVFFAKGMPEKIDKLVLVCWCVLHSTRAFFTTQFFLACQCICVRFEELNEKLLRFKKQKPLPAVDWRIGKLFNSLCDLIDILNDSFTTPFVLIFPNILIKAIFAAFALANELMLNSPDSMIALIISVFALMNYLSILIVVSWVGSKLKTTGLVTSKIIAQIMSEGIFDQKQKTDFMFLQSQARSRNVSVENFLFSINWKTLLSVSPINLNLLID